MLKRCSITLIVNNECYLATSTLLLLTCWSIVYNLHLWKLSLRTPILKYSIEQAMNDWTNRNKRKQIGLILIWLIRFDSGIRWTLALHPSIPKNKEKRGIKETNIEIEKSKVHQTNSRAVNESNQISNKNFHLKSPILVWNYCVSLK